MNYAKAEAIIAAHAEYFRALLDERIGQEVANVGGVRLYHCAPDQWSDDGYLAPPVAICAFIEAWRQRLDEQFGVEFVKWGPCWFPHRRGDALQDGHWVRMSGFLGRDCGRGWDNVVEALCAAAKAVAAEQPVLGGSAP